MLPARLSFLRRLVFATALVAAPGALAGFAALDDLVAAHRDATASGQALLRVDPLRSAWLAVPSPDARWQHVAGAVAAADPECPALLRHAFAPIQGGPPQSLCQYQGKVLLVVNTASQCGYTYQYEGLEALYRRYKDKGLVVVGFPSNDFGGQEPGSNREIAEFCRSKYGVQFPMYEKQSVTSLDGNPLYADLAARTGAKPRWNFHKYLVDRSGHRVRSFASGVEPGSRELVGAIERLLGERAPQGRS